MILIINATGARLCQDNCWRSFANFGTYPECVKEYRSLGHAFRRAKRIKGRVVLIEDGTIDASGVVEINGKKHELKEFLISQGE